MTTALSTTYTLDDLSRILLAEYESLTKLVYLLKEEQQIILRRDTDKLVQILARIEEQLPTIQQQQKQHEQALKHLIPNQPVTTHAGLAARVSLLPESVREHPLAVAQRIDVQLLLVHEFAWQNHVLLSHSLHYLKDVLAPFLGESQDLSVYGKGGAIQRNNHQSQALFQAVA